MGSLLSCGNLAQLGNTGGLLKLTAGEVTPISQLHTPNAPTATVQVQGQVMEVAPLLQGGAYRLQDSSGSIWVLTTTTLPQVGENLQIKGEANYQRITIAGQDLGESYIRELERQT